MLTIRNTTGVAIPTEILDGNGRPIGLQAEHISIDLTPGDVVKAVMRLGVLQTDITCGRAEWQTLNPASREYEPIEEISFRDGTKISFSEDGKVNCRRNGDDVPL